GSDVKRKTTPVPVSPIKEEDLKALIDRAQNGDDSAMPALRELLKKPANVDLLGGDLAKQAQYAIINKFEGPLWKEVLPRKLDLLRQEIAGSNPTPLERLLVERIVADWLHLHCLEWTYAHKGALSPDLEACYQRSMSSAEKRYLAAIKTLAQVRKMAFPV